MANYKLTILNFTLISLILLLIGNLAEAKVIIVNENTSSVISNVSVQSNTGGTVIINGEVIDPAVAGQDSGENNSSASVYTEINGEVVQDIHEEIDGSGSIEVYSNVQADDEEVHVKTVIDPADAGQVPTDEEQVPTVAEQDQVDAGQVTTNTGQDSVDKEQVQEEKKSDKKESLVLLFWQSIINKIKDLFSIFK